MSVTEEEVEVKTTGVVKYSIADKAIAELRSQFSGLKADTKEGYESVRKAIAVTRSHRVDIEKKRKELKADALEWGRKVDGEAKRLTSLLEDIENPLQAEKDRIDQEAERVKRAKEEAERAAIEAELRKKREEQEAIERAERERIAKEQAAENERLAIERAEIEKQRKELEEKSRIEREKLESERNAERERMADERRKIVAEQQRLERLEFERVAKEKAEQEAKAKIEREKIEQEKAAKAEQARLKRIEAAKPDVEKVHAFAATLASIEFPKMKTEEANATMQLASEIINSAVEMLRSFKVS